KPIDRWHSAGLFSDLSWSVCSSRNLFNPFEISCPWFLRFVSPQPLPLISSCGGRLAAGEQRFGNRSPRWSLARSSSHWLFLRSSRCENEFPTETAAYGRSIGCRNAFG